MDIKFHEQDDGSIEAVIRIKGLKKTTMTVDMSEFHIFSKSGPIDYTADCKGVPRQVHADVRLYCPVPKTERTRI